MLSPLPPFFLSCLALEGQRRLQLWLLWWPAQIDGCDVGRRCAGGVDSVDAGGCHVRLDDANEWWLQLWLLRGPAQVDGCGAGRGCGCGVDSIDAGGHGAGRLRPEERRLHLRLLRGPAQVHGSSADCRRDTTRGCGTLDDEQRGR